LRAEKTPVLVYHPRRTAEYERRLRPRSDLTVLACYSEAEVRERAAGAEVVFAWKLPPGSLAAARRLRFVQLMGAGADDLLGDPDFDRSVPVATARGRFGPWLAEYVLGMLALVEKDFRRSLRQQAAGRWEPYPVGRLHGKLLGVAGLGSGLAVARAAAALGMRVRGYRRHPAPVEGIEQVRGPDGLGDFLCELDYLALVLPLTPATRGLIGRRELERMKRTAWLVNVGRGGVLRERELVEALRDGVIAGAVLDVFEEEPLAPSSPLWRMDNVVLTPHIAAPSEPEIMVELLLRNLANHREGRPLEGTADPERGY